MTPPNSEVLELATAIREALDVPVADSSGHGARLAEEMLRLERAALVRGALRGLTDGVATVSTATATIREALAEMPVTYPVHQRAEVSP
ncbi:MoaD/ThiS family protein [Actinomadura decatromicini]|uniref:MoaD/ThiS family protein n=1 Tax=Actinomadura decatromicini TaxID=2604572 RepID=A0A5D3FB69_9ACTN|nr:MoaD/ThiS family protein [Actinomadura decatromicini]TYK45086.1 MoaD/ThiS family protein [Actinomadura decatromicini]